MWTHHLPDVDEQLRQGDLLVDVPFPKRGKVVLDSTGLRAPVKASAVVVVDHCCTVEQQHVVTLARVISTAPLAADARFLLALQNLDPTVDRPYAQYAHLLAPHSAIPEEPGKKKVIDLVDTINLVFPDLASMSWLCQKRQGRMTLHGRAQLRHKLALLIGRAEPEDRRHLQQQGLDDFARPEPRVHFGELDL